MRAMGVVVLDVDRKDALEVTSVQDEEAVEALTAGGADPSLGERVRVRRPYRCSDRADALVRNTSSNAAVNLLSRSWIRNRIGSVRSTNLSKYRQFVTKTKISTSFALSERQHSTTRPRR